mmetsp:Transcript_155120/g.285644  ORF Transcript_155120/g.285644 Transcript_155120/m.285644 type:complete len:215 (+) Transcript_155120:589-1233(+)
MWRSLLAWVRAGHTPEKCSARRLRLYSVAMLAFLGAAAHVRQKSSCLGHVLDFACRCFRTSHKHCRHHAQCCMGTSQRHCGPLAIPPCNTAGDVADTPDALLVEIYWCIFHCSESKWHSQQLEAPVATLGSHESGVPIHIQLCHAAWDQPLKASRLPDLVYHREVSKVVPLPRRAGRCFNEMAEAPRDVAHWSCTPGILGFPVCLLGSVAGHRL